MMRAHTHKEATTPALRVSSLPPCLSRPHTHTRVRRGSWSCNVRGLRPAPPRPRATRTDCSSEEPSRLADSAWPDWDAREGSKRPHHLRAHVCRRGWRSSGAPRRQQRARRALAVTDSAPSVLPPSLPPSCGRRARRIRRASICPPPHQRPPAPLSPAPPHQRPGWAALGLSPPLVSSEPPPPPQQHSRAAAAAAVAVGRLPPRAALSHGDVARDRVTDGGGFGAFDAVRLGD